MLETDELGRFKIKNMKIYEDDDGKLKEGAK